MKYIIKKLKLGKVAFFTITMTMFMFHIMLYESNVRYRDLLGATPEARMAIFSIRDDDWQSDDIDYEIQKIQDFYMSQEGVEKVYVTDSRWGYKLKDKNRNGISDKWLMDFIYDERYEKYIDGGKIEKLGLNEVILPRCYAPGDVKLYNKDGYIDATELVGKEIELTLEKGINDDDTIIEDKVAVKVVATYDSIAAGNDMTSVLISEETYNAWSRAEQDGKEFRITYENRLYIPSAEAMGWDEIEAMDKPEGYDWLDDLSIGTKMLNERADEYDSVIYICQSYKENLLFYGMLVPVIMTIIYVILGIKIKKERPLKQIAECCFAMIIAYMVSIGICIFMAVNHNKEIKELLEFKRYYTYGFDNIPLIALMGIVIVGIFALVHILDLKKYKYEYDDMEN